jgi:hypothetical protein
MNEQAELIYDTVGDLEFLFVVEFIDLVYTFFTSVKK